MTKDEALDLAKRRGVQFNISGHQYAQSILVFYTMLFFKTDILLSTFVLIMMMSYGIWDATPKKIGKTTSVRHYTFRAISTGAIWFICYLYIYFINNFINK